MKLIINTTDLNAGVLAATRALSAKSALPILEGIYICARGNDMMLVCTDMSLRIEATIPAEVREEGAAVVPGRIFSEMVRKLPGETVEIDGDESSIKIKSGRSRSTLQTNRASDYPPMPEIGQRESITIKKSLFRSMVRQTTFATAPDDSNPILTGVLMTIDGDRVQLVALDGFRLAIRRESLRHTCGRLDAVIPVKSLNEIGRIMDDSDDNVEIVLTKSHVMIDLGHTRVLSRLLNVQFINYSAILTDTYNTRVRLNRRDMLDTIERVSLMAREGKTNIVVLEFADDVMTISANSEIGRTNEEQSIEMTGEAQKLAFNAKYLIDALKSLEDEEIFIDLIASDKHCVIRPIDGEAFYYLILPVRMR